MKTISGKLSFYVGVVLFLALIAGLAVPMQTAQAAAFTVCASGCDYMNIQAAIDAASAGDTINVAAGTYAGQIIVNKSITILGDPGDTSPGPGPNAPVIDGGSAVGSAFFIANGVSNVTIQGFEMANFINGAGNGEGNGISAWEASTSNITIQDNYFHNLGWNGVLVGNDGATGNHTNWKIKNNILETFEAYGFELTNASNSRIENNIIHSNATWNLAATCILVVARENESGIVIKGNQLDGEVYAGYPAVYVFAWDLENPNVNLNDVLIEDNIISTTSSTGTAQVSVTKIGTGTVTGVQLHGNSLTLFRNSTPVPVDATANWWGTTNATTIASQITGSGAALVDYDPWYINAEMTILSDSVPTTVYVDATYTSGSAGGHIFGYDAFATIQEGITAVAEGGIVNVAAGTYTEQVTIAKSLHLIGAGVGSSVIAAPSTLPASGNATSSILLIGGSGVSAELTGFSVAGPGPSGCGSIRTGIYVYNGANANIHHNTIQDIRDSAFSGCQNGVAIAVGRQAWATTGTATIDHNTIIGYQKGGIVVDNNGSNATITNNTVTGVGTTDVIAQNGIQISRGANATLSGNTVTGNSFHLDGSGWDWGSAGILFYQAGSVTLSGGNTVSGNDQNLYIDSATAVTVGSETIGSSTAPINYGYDVINFTTLNINLTSVTFMGSANNFEIEDRIWHGGDEATSGLVTWVAGNLYVTPLSGVGAIQRAINVAAPGDIINVAAGTYMENITISKSVTLKGAQFGANVGGRTAASLGESTIQGLVAVNASDVNVNGFTLTNPGQTYAMSITSSSSNIAITNNIVDTVGAVGLAQNVHSIVFQNGADSVTIVHNRFNNIKASTKSVSAIGVLDSLSTNSSTGLLIQDNTFTDIASVTKGAYGVSINNAAGAPGAQIKDNTFSGLSGGWTHAIGLEGPTPNAIVTGNIFSGLTAVGPDNAALLFEKNPVGNTVTISKNQFNGTAFYGVAVHPNDLLYNYTVNAEENWWGSASGPGPMSTGSGALVGPNVNYAPWCTVADCSTLVTLPVHNVTKDTHYLTIQAAINAANNGDVINISAGTFIENVIVNKSVTLAGVGTNTIIQPSVSNPNCSGAGGGSLCAGSSNVFLVQADNVIIHDLTVDGDNPALTSGFDVGGANVDARNGIITNHSAGVYNGLEVYNVTVKNIYLRGMYASSGGTFNFHNNTVTNVQAEYASIAMFAFGGTGMISNNTISDANDAIAANWSNGTQFLNNTITQSRTGIHTDNAGSGAGAVTDLIQGNTITNCKTDGYGVFIFVPYLGPTVNNNTVTNCSVGLSAWGQAAAVTTQFTNNTVTGPAKLVGSVGAYITTDQIGYGYNDISVLFDRNIITNFETGVYLTADAQSWTSGWVSKTINATFHLNQINGNTNGADKGSTGTYVSDFENNWWGAVDGPSGVGLGTGDAVVAGFDYSPWCINSDCTAFAPPFATTTTITTDTPDPSLPGQTISVTATVVRLPAGPLTPSGTVTISGGVSDCSISLVSGTGSCDITFNTGGVKTITATYNPTSNFSTSSDTESHTVQLMPFLLSPVDGEVLHYNRPTFDWVDYPGAAGYQIQVSHNNNFEHRIVDTKTSATKSYYTMTDKLPSNATLYWRVRAKLGQTYTPWAVVWTLHTATPPSVPSLHSPSNNTLTIDLTPTFDWEHLSSSAFDHYQIQVDDSADFSSLVIDENLNGAANHTYTPSVDVNSNTKYYWRVRAWNTAGDYSDWSTVRSFREAILQPGLVTPIGGITAGSRKPVFDWNDAAGATGYTLQVSLNSSFSSYVLNVNVTSSLYTPKVNLSANKLFYWRVRANGSNGPSAWSVGTFRTP